MAPVFLPIVITSLIAAQSGGSSDARTLIDVIETLQQPIEDFRAEFEGRTRFFGKLAEQNKVGVDNIYVSFSGNFVWKRGGDTFCDSLRRTESTGRVIRETIVVRPKEQQTEELTRYNDVTEGRAIIRNPKEANAWRRASLGFIFLIDKLKRDVMDDSLDVSVNDDQINGTALKVLTVSLKGVPGSLLTRFWIDLGRSGQVVRQESYLPKQQLLNRLDIRLAKFRVGASDVWMPVSGDLVGYGMVIDKVPVVSSEPTERGLIYVIGQTMEFNNHPGREVFTIKYEPGTPVSDSLRKIVYEFGQQKVAKRKPKPTIAEAENALKEQLAKAEEQKRLLVVAPPSEGFVTTWWPAIVFASAGLISSGILLVRRKSR